MEAEWLKCTDPMAMLKHLEADPTSRKVLLLTGACLRRLGRRLPKPCRAWVRVAEQVAEGQTDPERLNDNYEAAEGELDGLAFKETPDANGVAYAVLNIFGVSWTWPMVEPGNTAWEVERKKQTAIIRELFGNPFQPMTIKRSILKSNDGTVAKLAQAIYEEHAFDRLPILADALEDAGCDNAEILAHCRSGGEHMRGCWVVDLILGKS